MVRPVPIRIAALILVVSTFGCGPRSVTPERRASLEGTLQGLIEAAVAGHDAVPGAALAVDSPRLQLEWQGAAGAVDPAAGTPMTPRHPVRIASNTKTFVAAAVLRLWERGELGLDEPIAALLPEQLVVPLRQDGYDPEAMTVRHLLTHTSGLFDHSEPDEYAAAILANPQYRWTPAQQLAAAMDWGEPLAPPGKVFSYCDTGYVLLGVILERATGEPLAVAVRELVGFDRLGLDSTWWESLEPAPPGAPERAHQFLGEVDTTSFDPSFDLYGGGGLVAAMGDLARFFGAIFRGKIFDDPRTLDVMLTTLDGLEARPDASASALAPGAYRMGVWVVEVDGLTTYRHTGFWGTLATYVPELDLTVACTVDQNQAKHALEELAVGAVRAVRDAAPDGHG